MSFNIKCTSLIFALCSVTAWAGPATKLPDTLNWICPVPNNYFDVQEKHQDEICEKAKDDFNRAYKKKGSRDKLQEKFVFGSTKWQRDHHEEENEYAWKESPELRKLNDELTKAYDEFNKAQAALDSCQKKANQDVLFTLNVYSGPDFKSKKLGQITINGLFQFDFADTKGESLGIVFDSYDRDGTACQTLWAQKGDWFKMPVDAFPEGVWINPYADWHQKFKPAPVAPDIVRGFPKKYADGFYIKEIKNGFIVGRPEMPYDMGECGPVDGSDETPAQEKTRRAKEKADADKVPLIYIPVFKAYDSRGHIIPVEKYTRGC